MREIIFRGKRIDNKEWIEGAFVKKLDSLIGTPSYFIVGQGTTGGMLDPLCTWYIVDPDTIGQYTGMKDRFGQRIFEGDVIISHYANVPAEKCEQAEQIVFHNGRFCSMYSKIGCKMWAGLPSDFQHLPQDKSVYMDWCEVIGNIHDNPELLKEA